jgi:hypothetical protein
LSNWKIGGNFLKKKIIALFAVILCLAIAASSCGSDISALENLCFAIREFDLEKAQKYVYDGEGYLEKAVNTASKLTPEQAEIAKLVYSHMQFSDFKEEDGYFSLTVKYVDFYNLKKDVEFRTSIGSSATEVLREMLEGSGFAAKYTKTREDVRILIKNNVSGACVPLGHASDNSFFTAILGLDTFLEWYTLQ